MRILYFTDDFSQENIQFAKKHGLTMRKRSAYTQVDTVEQCTAVCGDVPPAYLDKYPLHELPKTEQQKAEEDARLKAEAEVKTKAEAEAKAKAEEDAETEVKQPIEEKARAVKAKTQKPSE